MGRGHDGKKERAMQDKPIVIVSGLPRSGTSMMMQIITAGGIPPLTDNIRTPDEDNPRGYYEFEAVKKTTQDPSWLDEAPGRVVKMVHLLLYELPPDRQYHVVYTERRIDEVIASQNKMLERMGKAGGDVSDAQAARIFRQQIEDLKKWLAGRENFKVLYVDYNELVQGNRDMIERINDFLGGGLDREAMFRVIDPALYRQRKKS
jgi:hypothetical protein